MKLTHEYRSRLPARDAESLGGEVARALFKTAKLGTKELGGLTFRIDRPKGYTKRWPNGRSWTYVVDYGYVPRVKGEDGEGLDAFVGDDPAGHLECFQKLRRDERTGRMVPDETKFLLGVTDAERETIYKFYGAEVNARQVFKTWDEVKAAIATFTPKKHFMGKSASRDNPWAQLTPQGPVIAEDRDYEHLMRHFKYALLTNPSLVARERSEDTAPVTGAGPATTERAELPSPPSLKLKGPPAAPRGPKPLPVPSSSAPQTVRLKGANYGPSNGFVQPLDRSTPSPGSGLPPHLPEAEEGARQDHLARFFLDQLESRRNVAPIGSESTHGVIRPGGQ